MTSPASYNAGAPTPPIALDAPPEAVTARIAAERVVVDVALLDRLAGVCARVTSDAALVSQASRDWWPLAMTWALDGQVPALGAAVCSPATEGEVAEVLRIANESRIPVTAAGGRSGVCGASVPLHGGIVLDLTGLAGIRGVDEASGLVDVAAGTFGDLFEAELRERWQVTCGHWPQSVALSTVGGWLACRGAGQLSTRYGKIEHIVEGLDVVLADGRAVRTGGNPAAAAGPDLTQLFVGSEGTLGVITGARLRVHPAPTAERRAAYAFADFDAGLEACRQILRRGATPAVLRLYDAIEGARNFDTGDAAPLIVMDEGDPALIDAVMSVVTDVCGQLGADVLDPSLVERWFGHRNDVSALEALVTRGYVVDTMEISGPWATLPRIYAETTAALQAVDGVLAASAHQSHAYPDGACLYFTFAGKPAPGTKDTFYNACWDAGTRAVLRAGGSLSHHHGVGLNRSRFMAEALGSGLDVLASIKSALDPNGILNPGKLGLPSPFGRPSWP